MVLSLRSPCLCTAAITLTYPTRSSLTMQKVPQEHSGHGVGQIQLLPENVAVAMHCKLTPSDVSPVVLGSSTGHIMHHTPNFKFTIWDSGATRGGGRTAPGDTLQGGDTRTEIFCGQIYKELWTNEVGQVKKVV